MPPKRAMLGQLPRFSRERRCDSVPPLPCSCLDARMKETELNPLLHRIADALERLAPAAAAVNDLGAADAFIWHADREWLEPVPVVNRVALGLLRGIDRVRDILLENTQRFAAGLPANNVLLWGARGT